MLYVRWLLVVAALLGAVPLSAQDADIDGSCAALMTSEVDTSADAPAARIVEPDDGATVYGDAVTVEVDPDNFEIAEGNHWHVWVDGQMIGMVFEPFTLLELEPGTHTICALLGDAEHMDLGRPDGIVVTVAEAAAGTPTSPPARPDASAPQAEPERSPLTLVGLVVLGLIAAVGGWWLGKRLPKG